MWYQVSLKFVLPNGNVGRVQKAVDAKDGDDARKLVLAMPAVKELKQATVTSVAQFST